MSSRRKYSKEFKREAVRMADTPVVTLKQIAEELGINAHLLGKWRKQLREEGESKAFQVRATLAMKRWPPSSANSHALRRNAIFCARRQCSLPRNRSEIPHD